MGPVSAIAPPPVRGRLVLLWVGFVAAADWLFFRQPRGWTVGVYGLGLLAALLLDRPDLLRIGAGRALVAATAGLLVAQAYQTSAIGAILAVVGLVSLASLARDGWVPAASAWLGRWQRFAARGWVQLLRDLRPRREGAMGTGRRAWARTVTPWLAPVLLTLVFVGLFVLANPIIEEWARTIEHVLRDLVRWDRLSRVVAPGRLLFWLLAGVWVWALLRCSATASPGQRGPEALMAPLAPLLTPAFVIRSLALFNLVFAVQNLLDLRYLWGGAALPSGMTYAGYAHRGAYPLVVTALLAAAFMLVTFRPGSATTGARAARRLVYVWTAQNVFLTLSAAWRLKLYVAVYSLTRLRLAAAIWMALVALGLLFICWRIVRRLSNEWLMNVNLLSLIAILYGCALADINGFVAGYNVRNCREMTGKGASLDITYLLGLGPETLPALDWAAAQPEWSDATGALEMTAEGLSAILRERLRDWRGWTWRRAHLMRWAREPRVAETSPADPPAVGPFLDTPPFPLPPLPPLEE